MPAAGTIQGLAFAPDRFTYREDRRSGATVAFAPDLPFVGDRVGPREFLVGEAATADTAKRLPDFWPILA